MSHQLHDRATTAAGVDQILFLQSADVIRYARLLRLSSQTVQAFCSRHGFAYEQTLGIRYGSKPWHAALNRITILREYLAAGFEVG